jgi:hypothetical protein
MHELQLDFLNVVASAVPAMLEELKTLAQETQIVTTPGERLVASMQTRLLGSPSLPDAETWKAMRTWADRWHLATPWAIRLAWTTVVAWRESGSMRSFSGSFLKPATSLSDPYAVIRFAEAPYNPEAETYSEAQTRFVRAARTAVGQYLRAIRRQASRRPPAVSRSLTRDFWWTALYQCGGQSLHQISEDKTYKADLRTIRVAVRTTASRIDLPLRPPNRPGRRSSVQKN